MRARGLKPGFFKNEHLAELPFEARILFLGLWCMADREGRLEDRPARIKAEIFPYEPVDVDPLLDRLAVLGFITRYKSQAKLYIEVRNFKKHQNPHKNEKASEIPQPSSADTESYKDSRNYQSSTVPLGLTPDSLTPDSLTPDSPPTPRPVGGSVGRQLANDAEVERRMIRYRREPEADENDRSVLERVMAHLTSDRVTGKPLPHARRIRILDAFTRFQPGVVFCACHRFVDEGHLDAGKDHRYLAGICEASGTSDFIEHQNAKRKERHGIQEKPQQRAAGMGASAPVPIGRIMQNLRPREG